MPRPRLLIAEENPDILSSIKSSLESTDSELVVARDGTSVLMHLQKEDPFLIIMDLFLPVIDGWQILDLLKDHKRGTIPVIIISEGSRSDAEIRRHYNRVAGIVTIPIDGLLLRKSVETLLAGPPSPHDLPEAIHTVALINLDRKGKRYLKIFAEQANFRIIGVLFHPADLEAHGYADKLGIKGYTEAGEILSLEHVDFILNTTAEEPGGDAAKLFSCDDGRVVQAKLCNLLAQQAAEHQKADRREKKHVRDFHDKLQEFSLLNEMAQITASTIEMDLLLKKIISLNMDVLKSSAGAIIMYDEELKKFTVSSSCGLSEFLTGRLQLPLSDPAIEDIITFRREVPIADLQEFYPSTLFQLALKEGMMSLIAIPLMVKEKIIGILCLFFNRKREFSEKERHLLTTMAGQVAISIENAQLYKSTLEKQMKVEHLLSKIIVAQEEERKRIAGEIHDSIAQSMVGILTKVQTSQALLQVHPDEVGSELEELRKIVAESVREVREIIYNLRPSSLDDLGLVPSLENLMKRIKKVSGIDIELFTNEREKRLPPIVETVAFRITQEALNNVKKHSKAKKAWVELYYEPQRLSLKIVDNGLGFSWDTVSHKVNEGDSFGLMSMKERASLLGGTLDIKSQENRGTTVSAEIPIERIPAARSSESESHPHTGEKI